jgi:glycosyltransferase involved in cell wall biosynthesis
MIDQGKETLMSKILFLCEDLEHTGMSRQLTLLGKGLIQAGLQVRVAVLRNEGPLAVNLREAGIAVDILRWTRWMALGELKRLRQIVHDFSPDIVQTWGIGALRVAALIRNRSSLRVIAFHPLLADCKELSSADRWLLRSVERAVVRTAADARRLMAQGMSREKLAVVPPAVERQRLESDRNHSVFRPNGRFILCVGPFEIRKGHYDALWAFDILQYLYKDWHLVLVGNGPDKPRLDRLLPGIEARPNIHFLGIQEDTSALMRRAELVWVPSLRGGGMQVALEALAAGKTVVAGRVPELAELLEPLGADLLFPPGDKPALVRQTRRMLEDPDLRRSLAESARSWVERTFTVEKLVRRFEGLYHKQAG